MIKEETSLDAVRQPAPRRKLPTIPPTLRPPKSPPHNCRRCGRGAHPRHSCPAKDAMCFKCNRRGHYSSQCQSTTVAVVSTLPGQPLTEHTQQYYADTAYLNTVESTKENIWDVEVIIDKAVIKFKVDTGAEVTVLSEATWKILNFSEPLQKPSSTLCGPDHTPHSYIQKKMLQTTSLHCEEYEEQFAGPSSYQNTKFVVTCRVC